MIKLNSIDSAEMGGSPVFYVNLPGPYARATLADEMNQEGLAIDGTRYRIVGVDSYGAEILPEGAEVGLIVEPV